MKERLEQFQRLSEAEQMDQVRVAELEAYAMKPEEDVIAAERAEAPRKPVTYIPSTNGLVEVKGVPDLTDEQQQQHKARRFYAEQDAKHVVEADRTLNDWDVPLAARVVAGKMIAELTRPNRSPRPAEQIERITKATHV